MFVESRTDAAIYDALYQRYKSKLNSERSLVFIEVGKTTESGGEQNSGCEQVRRLVSSLSEGGNTSVFGLIDWDGTKQPSKQIHVLSHGIRNGLESLLFDPVLLVATIAKEKLSFCIEHNILDKNDTYLGIGNWEQYKWQQAVDKVQEMIIGKKPTTDTLEVIYLNQMNLIISREYLHMDDHKLENNIVSRFGFLKPKNKKAGELMRHVASSVLSDYPDLISCDLIQTFQKLLD